MLQDATWRRTILKIRYCTMADTLLKIKCLARPLSPAVCTTILNRWNDTASAIQDYMPECATVIAPTHKVVSEYCNAARFAKYYNDALRSGG
jgi:hypothetical protein